MMLEPIARHVTAKIHDARAITEGEDKSISPRITIYVKLKAGIMASGSTDISALYVY
jgi:hypothetical protein